LVLTGPGISNSTSRQSFLRQKPVSQPTSQPTAQRCQQASNQQIQNNEREREAALTKHAREKREEPGSSRVRRVQRCHRFVACMQRRNLPAGKTTLIGWEIYFYSDILISTTLLVFPPTWGDPSLFFYWLKDIAKMRNYFLKTDKFEKTVIFGGYQSPELRGETIKIARFIYVVFIV
jgi:hypothetical protein